LIKKEFFPIAFTVGIFSFLGTPKNDAINLTLQDRGACMMKKLVVVVGYLMVLSLIVGCGVSDESLNNAESRIKELIAKGVPDSSLSRPKVFLYQARDSKQRSDMGLAHEAAKSLRSELAEAEAKYNEDVTRLKPWIESQRKMLEREISTLTGMNKKSADSAIRIADSFSNINWLFQSEDRLIKITSLVPLWKMNEEVGVEVRSKIPGSWICVNVSKHSEDKTVNAVEKKLFTFSSDGKAAMVETKFGKSTPNFKEDWEFDSWGTWDVKGDSIFLFVNRFKAARQDFLELHEKDGKKEWVKKTGPRYDSVIVDGSQDRFVIYNDLITDFNHR
jgi:ribosomal protein S18